METVKITFLERLILSFGGFDSETIKNTNSAEKKRLITISLTLLVPVLLGACSGGYAISTISGNKWGWVFGLVYGFIIYLIDRAMISITNQNWFTYLMRVVMAVIVGLVISFPIKLLVFEDTIKEELHRQSQNKTLEIQNRFTTQINSINDDLSSRDSLAETYHRAWMIEMDGTGGTEKRGRGNISDAKEAEYRAKLSENQLYTIRKNAEIDSLNRAMNDEISKMNDAHAIGLLGQFKALGRVANDEAFIKIASYLLWAFFTLLELTPLLVKMASSGSLYDMVVQSNNSAKLVSVENTNLIKAEAETLAQKKIINNKMNAAKRQIAMDDVDSEAQMAEMYIQKIVDISKNESKRTREVIKTDLSDDKKDELLRKIEAISDYFGDRVYKTPFKKQELYDTIV